MKSSLCFGNNLRKRIVLLRRMALVLLTAVDLRRTIMYAAWPDNICLESTSLPPKGFLNILLVSVTIFISSYLHFSFKMQVVRRSLSLSIKIIYNQVLRDKRACNVLISEFPAPSPAIYININNFWLSREWIKINKTKRN